MWKFESWEKQRKAKEQVGLAWEWIGLNNSCLMKLPKGKGKLDNVCIMKLPKGKGKLDNVCIMKLLKGKGKLNNFCLMKLSSLCNFISVKQIINLLNLIWNYQVTKAYTAGNICNVVILGLPTAEPMQQRWGQLLVNLYITPKLILRPFLPLNIWSLGLKPLP